MLLRHSKQRGRPELRPPKRHGSLPADPKTGNGIPPPGLQHLCAEPERKLPGVRDRCRKARISSLAESITTAKPGDTHSKAVRGCPELPGDAPDLPLPDCL